MVAMRRTERMSLSGQIWPPSNRPNMYLQSSDFYKTKQKWPQGGLTFVFYVKVVVLTSLLNYLRLHTLYTSPTNWTTTLSNSWITPRRRTSARRTSSLNSTQGWTSYQKSLETSSWKTKLKGHIFLRQADLAYHEKHVVMGEKLVAAMFTV